ncbi:MAG TPA: hypothetical protein VL120_16285 [Solirubrobacteraceae bacterium]|nr:hypothetical protein [Solirubrobacteraceae bacterium]
MPSLTRLISAASLAATATLLVAAPGGSAAGLKSCPELSVKKSASLGATYVTQIKVQGVSCTGAQDVAKAFNKCRKEKGVTGHCTHKVKTYTCTETRPADLQLPTQANGKVKCRSGSKRVNFNYQQNK